jgi:hypothetical protein
MKQTMNGKFNKITINNKFIVFELKKVFFDEKLLIIFIAYDFISFERGSRSKYVYNTVIICIYIWIQPIHIGNRVSFVLVINNQTQNKIIINTTLSLSVI